MYLAIGVTFVAAAAISDPECPRGGPLKPPFSRAAATPSAAAFFAAWQQECGLEDCLPLIDVFSREQQQGASRGDSRGAQAEREARELAEKKRKNRDKKMRQQETRHTTAQPEPEPEQ